MAEEETETTENTETTEETAPVALIDTEGVLSEKWRECLPEDIRNEKSLDVCTTLQGMASQVVNSQKAIGKNKVSVITDTSSPTELDAFYTAGGRPKVAEDYPYEPDKDIPEELHDPERISRLKAVFFEGGGSLSLWKKLVKLDNEETKRLMATADAEDKTELDTAEQGLKDKWGMAYEERVHVVNRFINETTEEGEQRVKFIAKYGRDPLFVEWAAEVGKKLIEHKALVAEITQSTPKEATKKIEELQATEGYLNGELERSNPARHQRIVKELEELYKLAYPVSTAG